MIALFVLNAVRSRKLREEYSFLWLLIAGALLTIAIWETPLVSLTRLLGGVLPVNVLFFTGLIFLLVVSLFYAIRISELTNQIKELVQHQALLKLQIDGTSKTNAP
jgi:hypothetical protein